MVYFLEALHICMLKLTVLCRILHSAVNYMTLLCQPIHMILAKYLKNSFKKTQNVCEKVTYLCHTVHLAMQIITNRYYINVTWYSLQNAGGMSLF